MNKSRYTEEQIAFALKQAETGPGWLFPHLHSAAQGKWLVNHKRVYELYREMG